MNFVARHRKSIIAAVAAVLAIFLDSETAQDIAVAVGAALVYLAPNR